MTNTMDTPAIHPQWARVDLQSLGLELGEHLLSKRLLLIHAHSNLIWKDRDNDLVYKLTPYRARWRCEQNLRVVKEILLRDSAFPTVRPASMEVRDFDFQQNGRWVLTIWDYVPMSPCIPERDDVETYRMIGGLLSSFHHMGIKVPNHHDALQWAESRSHLIKGNASLLEEIAELRKRYEDIFSGEPTVTIHGDFHWHQTARDSQGKLLLLDFENVARGPAMHDLFPSAGWIKRTGSPTRKQMLALRSGYGHRWPRFSKSQEQLLLDIRDFSQKTWSLAYAK